MTAPAAVVIGGSAGALEVLRAIVRELPQPLSCPVVIVIHLPAHSSGLAELLGAETPLIVKQAEDKEPMVGGTVYIAPPSYHLLVESQRSFALSVDPPVHFSRPSIDVLFETASDVYGAGLIGVLLSGASEDGAAGLQEIHTAGGTTIVQSPLSAEVAIMPAAALALFEPTYIWSPNDIAFGLTSLLSGRSP
ncbi:chemotaxis protein CheB [Steroidobacter agaridevorans]|uniref:chemotaxis protein CheB n=1 Tax=Steroidobacter agaridevorans TaxID=2695856 RepID=UPI0013238CA3|nr:chemotaxis protein CheB [Steroidobacter agaridevorans]GFE91573.1 chemotaxis protein CheB [Steroidobacter agaridevorans]